MKNGLRLVLVYVLLLVVCLGSACAWDNQRGLPIDADTLFDDTYWCWTTGPTNGSVFAALFHRDGTLDYCRATSQDYHFTTYDCDGKSLVIDGIVYLWDGECFVSAQKQDAPMEDDGTHYQIIPDTEQHWRGRLDEILEKRQEQYQTYLDSFHIDKQLYEAVLYEGMNRTVYSFQYDEFGMLTKIVVSDSDSTASNTPEPQIVTTFQYDSQNRLIARDEQTTFDTDYRCSYIYDSTGKLTTSSHETVDSDFLFSTETSYEYDTRGVLQKAVSVSDAIITEGSFNYSPGHQQMVYEQTVWSNDDFSRSFLEAYTMTIDYPYKPFMVCDSNLRLIDKFGNGHSLGNGVGTELFDVPLYNPICFCDEDGYLIKAMDTSCIMEFYYR